MVISANRFTGSRHWVCLIKRNNIICASVRENLSSGFANNTDADQPAHPRSLISAFVIRFWDSVISKLAAGKLSISIF